MADFFQDQKSRYKNRVKGTYDANASDIDSDPIVKGIDQTTTLPSLDRDNSVFKGKYLFGSPFLFTSKAKAKLDYELAPDKYFVSKFTVTSFTVYDSAQKNNDKQSSSPNDTVSMFQRQKVPNANSVHLKEDSNVSLRFQNANVFDAFAYENLIRKNVHASRKTLTTLNVEFPLSSKHVNQIASNETRELISGLSSYRNGVSDLTDEDTATLYFPDEMLLTGDIPGIGDDINLVNNKVDEDNHDQQNKEKDIRKKVRDIKAFYDYENTNTPGILFKTDNIEAQHTSENKENTLQDAVGKYDKVFKVYIRHEQGNMPYYPKTTSRNTAAHIIKPSMPMIASIVKSTPTRWPIDTNIKHVHPTQHQSNLLSIKEFINSSPTNRIPSKELTYTYPIDKKMELFLHIKTKMT